VISIAAVLTGLIVGVVIASSGDDSTTEPVRTPELRPPGGTVGDRTSTSGTTDTGTTGDSTSTQTTPSSSPPASDTPSGGTPTPPAETPQNGTQNDNNAPATGGSPQGLDRFCEQNPGAC
jgi:hypothetical protein